MANVALGREFRLFQIAQDFLGPFQYGLWHTGEARDLNAVALVGSTVHNLAKKNDLIVPLAHGHIEILQARQTPGEFSQFVIVRGEKRARADLIVEILHNAPSERQSIKRAGAAPDLIEDDEAARTGVVEDIRSLAHFHHEGGLAAREIVAGANARKNAIDQIDARFFGRHE